MLTFEADSDHRLQRLGHDGLLGRGPGAQLRLRHGRVSAQHASVRYAGSGWELMDLGSRHGTVIEGVQLRPRTWVALRLGCTLEFGSSACSWTVVGLDAPVMCAQRLDTGERLVAQGHQIDFGQYGVDARLAFCSVRAAFVLHTEGVTVEVRGGCIVHIGGIPMRLWLPPAPSPGADVTTQPPYPATL